MKNRDPDRTIRKKLRHRRVGRRLWGATKQAGPAPHVPEPVFNSARPEGLLGLIFPGAVLPCSAFLLAAFLSQPLAGQESLADLLADPAVNLSRPADRALLVTRMAAVEQRRRDDARARAAARGLPLRTVTPGGRVQEITAFDGDQPVYFTTDNVNAAISTGANLLRNSPYSLSGSGITIGMWDGGSGRASHQEFGGRLVVKDGATPINHATHVGGTLAATGVVSSACGMANAAIVDSYDWNSDISEMTNRGATAAGQASTRIYLSNHSYGYVAGWNYVGGMGTPARTWEWNGNGTTTSSIEEDFGRYHSFSREVDLLAFNAPYYLIFQSAGNERADNPSSGQTVALSPGSSTVVAYDPAVHPTGDGTYRGGFDSMAFRALAKNVVTVGSVADAVTSGARDPLKATIASYSSWGPTDDGRIKPDVVANGESLYSSLNDSDTSYGYYSGTSMASPNACGSAALLVQQFSQLFPGGAMRASTLKGLLIHTADDRGNAGPDYKFGWGLVNVRAAADLLIDHQANPAKLRIAENQLTTSITTRTHAFVWDGASPIRATLCWTDVAGSSTTTSDLRTPRLVNNLQLKLVAPNGSEFLPFVMPFVGVWTQASMDLPATTGVNNTDNVEQVLVASPTLAGTWQAVVSFSGSLTNNLQNYSLLITGGAAEEPPPPPLAITSITPTSGLAGSTITTDITGSGLRADTAVKLVKTGQPDIPGTSVQLIGESLRCQFNLGGAAAGPWSVAATNPDNETSTLADAFTVIDAIWSQNFDGTVSGWTSETSTGSNNWTLTTAQSHSPSTSYFAPGPASKTTCRLISPAIDIPSNATNLQFKFWHHYDLQSTYDAGKLEFSVNGGTWFDVVSTGSGAQFASNGYNVTVKATGKPSDRNEFEGQTAWSGNSGGFIETIVNLTDTAKFAGKSLRARWIIATNASTASIGWYVDSVALLGGGDFSNQPPAIIGAPTSSSSETQTDLDGTVYQIIRAAAADLSVTADDDGGEPSLSYAWSASGPGPVFFSPNGNNTAKNTTAEFETTGDYQFTVTVTDTQGLSVAGSVNLRVAQTASELVISPANAALPVGGSQAFNAVLIDQLAKPMTTQPDSFNWSVSGGGAINGSGLFTATTAGGPFTVTATSGEFTGVASVTVNPIPATVTLGNLSQTYDGKQKPVTATTDPEGLAVAITYDGAADAPTAAGSYQVEAVVTDPNYTGAASGTLVISPGNDWDSWIATHFTTEEISKGLAAEMVDPDGDGLPNLAEYALGTDPCAFTPPLVAVLDENGLSITFTRPDNLPGLTYAAECSEDLDAWSPALLEVLEEGDPETVRARDPLTSGDPAHRFLRLRFTRD